jgi:hypothetical protein
MIEAAILSEDDDDMADSGERIFLFLRPSARAGRDRANGERNYESSDDFH